MENQQNIMPCDLEAERSVIGAMILDERAVDDAAEIVEPVDFKNYSLYTITSKFALISGYTLTKTSKVPSDLMLNFISIFFLSISKPC